MFYPDGSYTKRTKEEQRSRDRYYRAIRKGLTYKLSNGGKVTIQYDPEARGFYETGALIVRETGSPEDRDGNGTELELGYIWDYNTYIEKRSRNQWERRRAVEEAAHALQRNLSYWTRYRKDFSREAERVIFPEIEKYYLHRFDVETVEID